MFIKKVKPLTNRRAINLQEQEENACSLASQAGLIPPCERKNTTEKPKIYKYWCNLNDFFSSTSKLAFISEKLQTFSVKVTLKNLLLISLAICSG